MRDKNRYEKLANALLFTVENNKIRQIWHSIPEQLAKENNKFVFSHVRERGKVLGTIKWMKQGCILCLFICYGD